MNSYDRIYSLITETTGKGSAAKGLKKKTRTGSRDRGLQRGTSLLHAAGTAKPLNLPAERRAAPAPTTTTKPLLPSGEANPAYTAIIKRFTGKLNPKAIAAMKKRLSGSEENVSTQHGGSVRQARGK